MSSNMHVGECDGTPCPLFIGGYCTDLKPKEAGCVGKENCKKFEHLSFNDIDTVDSSFYDECE